MANVSSPMLLVRSASRMMRSAVVLQPGSLRASTFTVVTGMVGGGTLTFSYGIKMAGTLPALLYLLFTCVLSAYSTHALVFCAEQNNCRTFRKMAGLLYGRKTSIFIHINLLLLLWGAAISYMTLTKNLLSESVHDLAGHQWWDNKVILICSAACIILLPLGLMRRVTALRYSSLFGLAAFSFMVCVVVAVYFSWCGSDTRADGDSECLLNSIRDRPIFNTALLDV